MIEIKEIRKNLDFYKKKLSERNNKTNLDKLIILDKENRELIQKKELLEQEKKTLSKSKDTKNFEKSKKLSKEISDITSDQYNSHKIIHTTLSTLPNIALDDVPVGINETSNKIIYKKGYINNFEFFPKSHDDLGKNLNMIDFELATKTTGTRFVFLKDSLAKLERALISFMIDSHTKKNGYTEISPPLIANNSSMFGTGQMPKFENDQFEIKLDDTDDRKFLIPTAEVILTNMVREKNLPLKDLPIRMVAATSCFRKEAGSYGKDTKGMIRQHQFYKVELVSIVQPNECLNELDRMTACAEGILIDLKLPFRKLLLSTGDMGFSAEKTFDLEVWIPSENKYREISSCSSCGTFQAKRMKAKFKNKENKMDFVGTLNGSGLAVGRTLIAIMENYQQKNGTIKVPEVLKSYMNNESLIK